MAPVQQAMPLASRAAAQRGDQSSRTARRHRDAASFFPGAIGGWSDEFIGPRKNTAIGGESQLVKKCMLAVVYVARIVLRVARHDWFERRQE